MVQPPPTSRSPCALSVARASGASGKPWCLTRRDDSTRRFPDSRRPSSSPRIWSLPGFIRGASYLLTGESRQAVDTLTRVIDSDNGSYGEWALWLRSKAHLASGEVEAARRDLEAVIQLEGELEARAQQLLNELSG